jgi:CubicO group peptidase (beta-lactamase class C family)
VTTRRWRDSIPKTSSVWTASITGAIADSAFPGAQLAIIKDGLLVYDRSFGRLTYDAASPPVDEGTMYDLASVTKVIATTSAVMKLVDSGKDRA